MQKLHIYSYICHFWNSPCWFWCLCHQWRDIFVSSCISLRTEDTKVLLWKCISVDNSKSISVVITVTKPTRPPAICRRNERVCDDGTQCVHRDWICDGSKDCRDGSDEKQCGIIGCTSLEFTCSNQVCIPKDQRCDGKDNCGDNSDERSCRKCL